eukprot:Transcript_5519.p1 GENE.Transcript_5519~~Transcript_5519.p1  ORF type:complete len:409 (+),score=134.47 Transcript_5519:84-1310(+)
MEPISCSCSAWRRVRAPALFIEFRLDMRCGEMQWVAWRRFSEFARLRRSLGRRHPAARKPLPGKNLKRHTTEPEDLKKRAPALAAWLCTVLQAEGAMSEVLVLEFVGLAATLPSTSRPPVHVSVLPAVAETGDLMLFRTKAAVPALQRAVTRSDWDHVGLVMHLDWRGRVCGSQSSAECGFIECDASGTHFYGLQQYEFYKWHLQYEQMALRQLEWDERGDPSVVAKLQAWYDEVKDKPYSLSLGKITQSADHRARSACLDHDNFFCSELVAYAYQRLGLLPTSRPACGYWPVTFSQAAQLRLEGGAALGDELPVDFLTPAVNSVRAVPRPEDAAAAAAYEAQRPRDPRMGFVEGPLASLAALAASFSAAGAAAQAGPKPASGAAEDADAPSLEAFLAEADARSDSSD